MIKSLSSESHAGWAHASSLAFCVCLARLKKGACGGPRAGASARGGGQNRRPRGGMGPRHSKPPARKVSGQAPANAATCPAAAASADFAAAMCSMIDRYLFATAVAIAIADR